jgi:hypothetical protein
MELWFLCTALPLNVLDHCMKLYWIPTISLQVMLRTRKMQRTAGPTDHRVTQTSFKGYKNQKFILHGRSWICNKFANTLNKIFILLHIHEFITRTYLKICIEHHYFLCWHKQVNFSTWLVLTFRSLKLR